jgi:hypothetical protein
MTPIVEQWLRGWCGPNGQVRREYQIDPGVPADLVGFIPTRLNAAVRVAERRAAPFTLDAIHRMILDGTKPMWLPIGKIVVVELELERFVEVTRQARRWRSYGFESWVALPSIRATRWRVSRELTDAVMVGVGVLGVVGNDQSCHVIERADRSPTGGPDGLMARVAAGESFWRTRRKMR